MIARSPAGSCALVPSHGRLDLTGGKSMSSVEQAAFNPAGVERKVRTPKMMKGNALAERSDDKCHRDELVWRRVKSGQCTAVGSYPIARQG